MGNGPFILTMVAAGAVWIAAPTSAADSYYTDTRHNCRTVRNEVGARIWRCNGPGGYAAVFSDDGNVVDVEYGPVGREKNLGGLQWRAGPRPIGPKVEWRLSSGKPFAAILRIETRDENDRLRRQLLIAKVDADGACRIEVVDARQVGANALARQIADTRGAEHDCVE
jgi:hypothetical protein